MMDHSASALSPVHFVIMFFVIGIWVLAFVLLWPLSKVLRKMGYSGWWSLLYFVPFGVFVGIWMLATSQWPLEQRLAALSGKANA